MKLLAGEIVENSGMIKNYKTCREKAEGFGKIFILKNNQPDAVLFSITECLHQNPCHVLGLDRASKKRNSDHVAK